ncbi:MAG: hypothetical protein KZQ58_10420 [gamma proteobacterium symbiont of Bathyaustriella thionipta]|nr:hypothetical protein [gamma proteobacterium symbiont of Bathyaustriella thionipta]
MSHAKQELIYESKGSGKSLWNTYRIFNDRIELECRIFFRTIIIPKNGVVRVAVYSPPVIRSRFWALKLDLADFYPHVEMERKTGWFKHLRFTPADPEKFKKLVLEWMQH